MNAPGEQVRKGLRGKELEQGVCHADVDDEMNALDRTRVSEAMRKRKIAIPELAFVPAYPLAPEPQLDVGVRDDRDMKANDAQRKGHRIAVEVGGAGEGDQVRGAEHQRAACGSGTPSSPCSWMPMSSRSQSEPAGPIRETPTGRPLRVPTPAGSAATGKPVQSQ